MIWAIIFWVSVCAILHSYLVYPLIISILARKKKENELIFDAGDNLPFVSVIMAVHNEEAVIFEKLRSIFKTSYPEEKIELLVGSDASDDNTDEKLHVHSNENEALRFYAFRERRGKPAVINELRDEAMGEILILTDAQVIFNREYVNCSYMIISGHEFQAAQEDLVFVALPVKVNSYCHRMECKAAFTPV